MMKIFKTQWWSLKSTSRKLSSMQFARRSTCKYFKILNTKNRRDSYLEDFKIARSLTERRAPLIILLGGTSGIQTQHV